MPLSRFAADAFGVVTIFLVASLILLGLLCIAHSFYFLARVRNQKLFKLTYFSGPWIIRITFILLVIIWSFGELLRLTLLRRKGRAFDSLTLKWQETVCKGYILSNLGFAEPSLFLTLAFLLRAPLQKSQPGILSRKWNGKTAAFVLAFCSPVFLLQLLLIRKYPSSISALPLYFTISSTLVRRNKAEVALCTYPLLNTLLLGLFSVIIISYLFWLGRRILKLVINKSLQKRVYLLIISVSSFLPMRVLLLGLSVLSQPEYLLFEILAFLAFFSLSCCAGICICMLVYFPVADALALRGLREVQAAAESEVISLLADADADALRFAELSLMA